MRQGSNKMSTVESVALRLQELFTTLQIYTPKAQIRYFLDAIDPDLACQLEQLPTPFKSFNEVVEAAKRIESAKKRYQLKKNGDQEKDVNSPNQGLGIIRPPKIVAYASTASDSQTNILEKLLQQFTEMKLLLKKQQEDTAVILNNRQFRRDTTSVLTCYNCGQTGHKKPDCPKLVRTTPATGANVVPINDTATDVQSNYNTKTVYKQQQQVNSQTFNINPRDVNFVDSQPSAEVMAAVTKRRRTDQEGTQLINEPVQPINTPMQPPLPVASGSRVILPNQLTPPPELTTETLERKKHKTRAPLRQMAITVPEHPIWQKLKETNAGLSLADWLYLSRKPGDDIMAGLRYWRKRTPKKNKGKAPVRNLLNPDNTNRQTIRPMEIAAVNHDLESTDDDYEMDYNSSTDQNSEYEFEEDTDEETEGFFRENPYDSDTSSMELLDMPDYPYSLERMRASSPLKGTIYIKGQEVEAIFDSGASVSVITKELSDSLGLTPNGDQMYLVTFDDHTREPCDITLNVPVVVAGELKPEHMCIQKGRKGHKFCLLGIPWFKQHGIELNLKSATVRIPTKKGTKTLQCHTEHKQSQLKNQELRLSTTKESQNGATEVYAVSVINRKQQEIFLQNVAVFPDTTNNELLVSYMEELMTGELGCQEKLGTPQEEMPEIIQDVLLTNKECFVEVSGLGLVDFIQHEIPTLNEAPIRSKPFRLTWEEEKHLKKELQEMLDLGLIRPSNGTWTSPVFFVKKKDGSLRLVIDYRKLNKMTIKDAFPLPLIDELLDALGGATIFSTLDAASGYWQVPMAQNSISKTGFVTKHGTFEFNVMPFGLTSAPATYQRMMTSLLQEYIGKFVMVFIDDIIIYSRNLKEHVDHLQLVFNKCAQANLRLKKKKCHFARSQVEYLGHVVTARGLLPARNNVRKVLEFRVPQDGDEVRSFLGTSGYYRRFIQDYATMAEPLTKLLKKSEPFVWNDEQQIAFEYLKWSLSAPRVLAYPDREKIQILTTDASTRGIGAILSQSRDGSSNEERVIAYASRTLRNGEKNYSVTHLEALALFWGVNYFRHYLLGRRFILRTDHSALTYIIKPVKQTAKLTRWASSLMEYDFELQYIKGADNPADALSRLLQDDLN
ncbi:hypothetical protein G6F71_009002 [Rhizopus microsporus]|nr:hypothetical protein G6F71_009002 [Rhizopus microsporus]